MPGEPLPFDVALLPGELTPGRVRGRAAVVIDVLRFSTSAVCALQAGAPSLRPTAATDEALGLVERGEADLACGERGGLRPPGFHIGNSPLEYTKAAVSGRRLACTTTNGTRALLACRDADTLFVGCLRNAESLARHLLRLGTPVVAACAGTEGCFALEDALAAGALAARLSEKCSLTPTDGARAALALWRSAAGDIVSALRSTDHGRALAALGLGADVELAALREPGAPVPAWDAAAGLLVPLPPA